MKVVTACLLGLTMQGCASIVSGSTQSLSVETKTSTGAQVAGETCKMTNDKGAWFVTTPGSVSVHRSLDDLTLICTKDGFAPATDVEKSATKGMAFGNILFGGLIGTAVDVSTGAAYDYPTLISVPVVQTPAVADADTPSKP